MMRPWKANGNDIPGGEGCASIPFLAALALVGLAEGTWLDSSTGLIAPIGSSNDRAWLPFRAAMGRKLPLVALEC